MHKISIGNQFNLHVKEQLASTRHSIHTVHPASLFKSNARVIQKDGNILCCPNHAPQNLNPHDIRSDGIVQYHSRTVLAQCNTSMKSL
mmetsp:Transcript_5018/g.11119  ORF Transcript_5018/g.11119 Transcript_5018/m.11119 type:complete len:88 (-) Transcript_5018:1030-1293(-)